MKAEILPGKYIVAVSGGVDSVVLLHVLRANPDLQLTVAHYDHGIRADSKVDRLFVQDIAKQYGLPFVFDSGQLGAGASEADARTARYNFLQKAQSAVGAKAIVTAHHQDDVLETLIINLMRGTGRKGLSSLTTTDHVVRPLLGVSKRDIIAYAKDQGLIWHEDSTNASDDYLRNRIRHSLTSRWDSEQKNKLLAINQRMQSINKDIDELLSPLSRGTIRRGWFVTLPHDVAREVIAAWLRLNDIADFDAPTIERLTIAGKVAAVGKTIDVVKGRSMQIRPDLLALTVSER